MESSSHVSEMPVTAALVFWAMIFISGTFVNRDLTLRWIMWMPLRWNWSNCFCWNWLNWVKLVLAAVDFCLVRWGPGCGWTSPHFINDRIRIEEPKLKLEGPEKLDLVKSFLSIWFPGRNWTKNQQNLMTKNLLWKTAVQQGGYNVGFVL